MTTYSNRRSDPVTADEALDASGNLRASYGMRTPLHMMDSMQRDIAEHFGDKRGRKTLQRGPIGDAVTGLFDSRGVYFPPDQRLVDAQRMTEYLSGRDAASRQMWLDGRAAVDAAREEMINDISSAPRRGVSEPLAAIMPRRAVSFADAQRIKREAWEAMRDEEQNAWKERR